MSDNGNTQACADDTRPCVKGCGFYGSAQTGYMCSKCFKDTAGVTRASIESTAPSSSSSSDSAVAAAMLTRAMSLGEEVSVASPLAAAGASASGLGSVDSSQGLDAEVSQSQVVVGIESGSSNGSMSTSRLELELSAVPLFPLTTKDLAAPAAMEGMVAGGGEAAAAAAAVTAPVVAKKNKNRCFVCNKKVGLTGIECRCEGVFCGVHRYPSQHACSFDHKEHDRANLKTTLTGGGQFAKMTDQL